MEQLHKMQKTDYRTYRFSKKELALTIAAGFLAGLLMVWICYSDWRAIPAAIPAAWVVVRLRRKQLCEKRQWLLLDHFREFIPALYANLAAGYSLENSVRQSAQDMRKLYGNSDVLVLELNAICRELSWQVPVEQLFYDFGERSNTEDIRCFGEILMIAKRTGGNLDKVIRTTRRTICERIDTRREIETITAAKRYEHRLMSIMPAGIIVYLRFSFGGFLDPMYGTPAGAAVMTAALAVYLAALWLGTRIIQIKL